MDYIIKDTTLTAIADSIRAKTGGSDPIAVADMATQIDGITGGGGGGSVDGYATVTFMNGAEMLFSRMVLKGDDCPDPYVQGRIELPTKESTVDKVYTFNGWATTDGGSADSNALKGITEDKVLYAAFAESVRKYTVTYYDTDGVTVLHTEQVAYGTTPSYEATKEGAVFGGWTPNTPVTGDTSYTVSSWIIALASGTCGDNATWVVDGGGVLTVSGTGSISAGGWKSSYSGVSVTAVVIGVGITEIGADTFTNLYSVKSITIPPSLTAFGGRCFYNSGADKNVYISDLIAWCALQVPASNAGVTGGGFAYLYLNGELLTDLTVPASVTTINANVFNSIKGLQRVTIHANVTSIGIGAFSNASNLTSATFEDPYGWANGDGELPSADLTDPATAASRLKTYNYAKTAWTKS